MFSQLVVKLYDNDGTTFKKTLSNKYFSSKVQFSEQKDYWFTSFIFKYNVSVDNTDISHADEVKVIYTSSGTDNVLYHWKVYGVNRVLTAKSELLEIKCLGMMSVLTKVMYESASSYSFNKTADASDIVKDIFGVVNTQLGTSFSWDGTSIPSYWTTINVDFDNETCYDALRKVLGMVDYYLTIDWDDVVYFKAVSSTPDHYLTLGNDVVEIEVAEDSTNLFNDYILEYSWGSTVTDSDSTSITAYGQFTKYITKTDIKDSTTATEAVATELAKNKDPKEKVVVIVNSNYDLESFAVGQMVTIRNSPLNLSNKIIYKIDYKQEIVVLHLDDYDTLESTLSQFN